MDIKFIVVPLCRVEDTTQRPGPVPGKEQQVMVHTMNWVYSVEKTNGANRYALSISHTIYDNPVNFGTLGLVTEIFTVHYTWKNAKHSMNNLTLYPTRTLAESMKLAEKKIKQMEEKIK